MYLKFLSNESAPIIVKAFQACRKWLEGRLIVSDIFFLIRFILVLNIRSIPLHSENHLDLE